MDATQNTKGNAMTIQMTNEAFDRGQNRMAAKQVMTELAEVAVSQYPVERGRRRPNWWEDFSAKLDAKNATLLQRCREQFEANLGDGEGWCPNCGNVERQHKTFCWFCNGYVEQG